MKTKIAVFSDTHTYHEKVLLPECDIAIFCGDMSNRGERENVEKFMNWYNKQSQCKNKILIAGNHDNCFDPQFELETRSYDWLPFVMRKYNQLIYLQNNSVKIDGLKIFGSPVTPWFHGDYWAFNMHRDESIRRAWEAIPGDADIVVTHGPNWGMHDYCNGDHVGCEELDARLEVVKPKLFCCGHIHEGYGKFQTDHTLFVNGAICNEKYQPVNKPIVVEL